MSPMSKTARRQRVVAGVLAVVAGLLVWLLGSEDQAGQHPPAARTGPTGTAEPTPAPAPSSGPTGAPSPGSLDVVPVEEVTTARAVPLTATADFGTGMTLRIVRIERVAGVARGPGEIAGPALRLTLRMSNGSDSAVSLESAVVDLTAGADRTPAPTLTGPGGRPFAGEVPAGGSMTAVYVFAVPEEEVDRVQVAVSYLSGAPVVVLAGAAA